jgi:hypothetical protein
MVLLISCRSHSPRGAGTGSADLPPNGSARILADPLKQPEASPDFGAVYPSEGDERDCPRMIETFTAEKCDGLPAEQQLSHLWREWRMCADVSGLRFDPADEATATVSIRGGHATFQGFVGSAGISSGLESCMRATAKGCVFRQLDGCRLTLHWSPLPKPDCKLGRREP